MLSLYINKLNLEEPNFSDDSKIKLWRLTEGVDAKTQKHIQILLEKQGHIIYVADDGRKILEKLEEDNFDCVLLREISPSNWRLNHTAMDL